MAAARSRRVIAPRWHVDQYRPHPLLGLALLQLAAERGPTIRC
jgi:hypothetical protein